LKVRELYTGENCGKNPLKSSRMRALFKKYVKVSEFDWRLTGALTFQFCKPASKRRAAQGRERRAPTLAENRRLWPAAQKISQAM
jgi:hypothetical protein